MTQEQTALMERWNGFLQKIDARLRELMAEAEQGLGEILRAHPEDPLPLGNALSGLDHRVRELRDKIQETWEQQVDAKFQAASAGRGDAFLDQGLDRKKDAELAFDETWAAFKARASSAFFRNLWPRAQAALAKPVGCTRCGGALPIAKRHEAASLNCPYCGVVNQVIPETAVAQYFGGAGHAFGDEAALPLRYAIERFREQVHRERRAREWADESVESLERWEQMELAYWTRYAEVKASLLGEPADQELVRSRMASFRQYTLETDQRWRRAKGLL